MKNLFFIFLLIPISLMSQNKSDSTNYSMRDSLEILTKRIEILEAKVNKNYKLPDDNFKDKTIGFEINPGLLLFGNVSGGIQLFFIDKTAEISIPFYYYNKNNDKPAYDISMLTEVHTTFDLDIQYRKFSNNIRNGSWAGAGLKYTHVEMNLNEYYDDETYKYNDYYGIVFGVGYRNYGTNGFYYGISAMIGRYFNFGKKDSRTERIIFTVEFLKLGYAF